MDYQKILRDLAKQLYYEMSGAYSWPGYEPFAKNWDSILINRRKPVTCRMIRQFGENRVCIHRFDPCTTEEAFAHPHPWPGAFMIVKGGYELRLGKSVNRTDSVKEEDMIGPITLRAGSVYEMSDPLLWHTVRPLQETITIMVNGPRYAPDVVHIKAPTTTGKNLPPLEDDDKTQMLIDFAQNFGTHIL